MGRWLDAIDRYLLDVSRVVDEQSFRTKLLVAELCSNARRHGGGDAICLGVRVGQSACVHVSFVDNGKPFDMAQGGTLPEDLCAESGRGLFLIAELASERRYRRWRGFNIHHFALARDPDWESAVEPGG